MAPSNQLKLFPESPKPEPSLSEKAQKTSWSYNKRSLLEKCPRAFYYVYYGSNKRTAKKEPHKEMLNFLKRRVQTRYLLSGTALHTVIKSYFSAAKSGQNIDSNRLVNFARHIFRESWDYSRKYPDGQFVPKVDYPPVLLKEYFHKWTNAETCCRDEENRLLNAVNSFFENKELDYYRKNGTRPSSLVEQKVNLNDFPCRVDGRIDLAFPDSGKIVILDWKLGASDGLGDNSLQLAFYGIWAVRYFNCSPDRLDIYKIHLSTNEIIRFHLNSKIIAHARACILQDVERFIALENYGKNSVSAAFTPVQRPKVCQSCIYESICYDRDKHQNISTR